MSNMRALLVAVAAFVLVAGGLFCLIAGVWLYAAFPH
jgi:hypothetical protein